MAKNWKEINFGFTNTLKEQWELQEFDYEQAKRWIEIGLKPEEVYFAKWLRKKEQEKSYNFDITSNNVEDLRKEYQNELGRILVKEVKEIRKELISDIGNSASSSIFGGLVSLFAGSGGESNTAKLIFFTTDNKLNNNFAMSIEKTGKYWVYGPFSYQFTLGGEAEVRNRNEIKGALISISSNEKKFAFSTLEEAERKAEAIAEERKIKENKIWKELLDVKEKIENERLGVELDKVKQEMAKLEKGLSETEDKLQVEKSETTQLQTELTKSQKENTQLKKRIKFLQSGEKPRNILIIGRTGSGKSTLSNVLLNKNGNFEKVFREETSSGSVTKNLQIEELESEEGISYHIIDTVGVGDTGSISQDEAWAEITKAALSIKEGFNQILFVVGSRNEVDEKEMQFYNLLKDSIIGDDIGKYTTIVRTKFESFDNEKSCEDDTNGLKNNRWISEMVKPSKVIHVNNPSLDGYGEMAKEKRESSRKKLLTHLETCRESYKPERLKEFINKLSQSKVAKEENIEIQKGTSQKWDAERIKEIAKTAKEIMEEVAPALQAVVVVSAACKIM